MQSSYTRARWRDSLSSAFYKILMPSGRWPHSSPESWLIGVSICRHAGANSISSNQTTVASPRAVKAKDHGFQTAHNLDHRSRSHPRARPSHSGPEDIRRSKGRRNTARRHAGWDLCSSTWANLPDVFVKFILLLSPYCYCFARSLCTTFA